MVVFRTSLSLGWGGQCRLVWQGIPLPPAAVCRPSGGDCAVRKTACQPCRTGGQRRGKAECKLLPPPFYALRRLCSFALRLRTARTPPLWLIVLWKNTALSRGWCMPLTRGSAVCGAERIAQHANPGLLS